MKLMLAAAIFGLFAMPAVGFGQQGSSLPKAPKPTRAEAEKVAQIISGDNAKLQAYCESKKLYDHIGEAYKKNDSKTADALNKQADALVSKLGPEYLKMMDGLEQVDQNSSEAKEFMAIFSGLDKLCAGPTLAEPAQPTPPAPHQSATVKSAPDESASDGTTHAKPCAEIRAACLQAGFVPNGANMGIGIIVDCIRPIMSGAPQRKWAAKPLPQIDPQLVVACKNRNANFGGWANTQPGGPPANPPSAMDGSDR